MAPPPTSPRIAHLSWGRLVVDGHEGAFKDAKLFPGGSREWDWRETGTQHVPGIQPADVDELLAQGATTVILSNGMLGALGVCPETIERLRNRCIQVHALRTQAAAELYNELRQREAVGGLFHSTC